jgi:hypothetical protein
MPRKNILPIAEVVDNKDRRKIWLLFHILAPKGIRFILWYNGKKYPLLKNTALIIFETISTSFSHRIFTFILAINTTWNLSSQSSAFVEY